jgi:hypothetical protein
VLGRQIWKKWNDEGVSKKSPSKRDQVAGWRHDSLNMRHTRVDKYTLARQIGKRQYQLNHSGVYFTRLRSQMKIL